MKNKRFLLLLIIIILWMTVPTTEAKAVSGFAGSGLTWEIRDSNTNITGYNKEFVLIIQGNGYLDSDISPWREYADRIVGISIWSGVLSIDARMFQNMPYLTSVSIADSVTRIGDYAFYNCPRLSSVYVPNNVTYIGMGAFQSTALTNFYWPSHLTSIPANVFTGSQLSSIIIPNGVTHIGEAAFANCAKLDTLVIPTSVTSIGTNAFKDCANLKNFYYCGTKSQWDQIQIGDSGSGLENVLRRQHAWQRATCEEPETCKYCDETQGVPIGHDWHDATCTLPRKCGYCGKTEGDALGHDYQIETVIEPTCKKTGSIQYACTRCSRFYWETTEKSPHTYGSWEAHSDTQHIRYCSVCHSSEYGEHTLKTEGVVTDPPTCGRSGNLFFDCTICNGGKYESIPATGAHSYGPWLNGNINIHQRICSVCGTWEDAPHAWDEGVITQEPTCVSKGTKTYTCTVCNSTKTESVPILTDHAWNSGAIAKWPTCKEEGTTVFTCTLCGNTKSEATEKLTKHTYEHPCDTTCNVCDAERIAVHAFSDTWSKNAESHFLVCDLCGEQKDITPHTPGPAATETTPQTCTICGYIIAPTLKHAHDFSGIFSTDKNGHWYACSGCEEQQSYAAHNFENACDIDCADCGYQRQTTHIYGTVYEHDANSHWFSCTLCGEKTNISTHEPGPSPTATTAQVCTICNREIAPPLSETTEPTPSPDKPPAPNPPAPDIQEESIPKPTEGPSPTREPSFPWLALIPIPVAVAIVALFIAGKRRKNH